MGWLYLDWVIDRTDPTPPTPVSPHQRMAGHGLGWMDDEQYREVARKAALEQIIRPLVARAIPVEPTRVGLC